MEKQRTKLAYSIIFLKGMAMGMADLVPGVSGGTIAFISGIYEELLTSISTINFKLIKTLKTKGIKFTWKQINGNFLLALFSGIGVSAISLAKLISWLLKHHPILVWSFFFGLVLSSILYIIKQVEKWNILMLIVMLFFAFLAYWITSLPMMNIDKVSSLFIFFSGALAVCAMILPGISGSFILVLLGSYQTVLHALKSFDIKTILIFITGCVLGLISFANLLKYLFKHYKNITLAGLTGFIIGSLNKIWPWKEVISYRINSHKEKVPFNEQSISPFSYENPQLEYAIPLMIFGFVIILILERMAEKKVN